MNTDQEIARIAYELYLKRGGAPGDPVTDWTTAERIYAERRRASSPAQTTDRITKPIELREKVSASKDGKANPKDSRKVVKTEPVKAPAIAKVTAAKTAAPKAVVAKPVAEVSKAKAKKKS